MKDYEIKLSIIIESIKDTIHNKNMKEQLYTSIIEHILETSSSLPSKKTIKIDKDFFDLYQSFLEDQEEEIEI